MPYQYAFYAALDTATEQGIMSSLEVGHVPIHSIPPASLLSIFPVS